MILKSILVLHRYLGVLLGVLMTVWCLSGFVMMYQGFPNATPEERRSGLASVDLSQCCDALALADDAAAGGWRINMLDGEPVLRTGDWRGGTVTHLPSGQAVGLLDEAAVARVADAFAEGNGVGGHIRVLEQIRIDQWVAQTARTNNPVWRAKFDDPAKTWVYVNGTSGEVFQHATVSERWLSWFGAVPHWLYPTILRENQQLWSQSVIWLSAIGCFLTITGMVVGFAKLRTRTGKWWPYRRRTIWMWHHVVGTFAGVLVLTWTFSGLLTMSPWGLLESPSPVTRADLASTATWGEVRPLLEQAKAEVASGDVVEMRVAAPLDGPHVVLRYRDGSEMRIGAEGSGPVAQEALQAALTAKGGLLADGKLELLEQEDAYYYGHKQPVTLPVWRLQLTDKDATRVYFSTETGEVARVADATAKRYRWFESGFHSFDWPVIKSRPIWDVVTLILMAAVTVACATGAWMSFTRIGGDAKSIGDFFRRRSRRRAEDSSKQPAE